MSTIDVILLYNLFTFDISIKNKKKTKEHLNKFVWKLFMYFCNIAVNY